MGRLVLATLVVVVASCSTTENVATCGAGTAPRDGTCVAVVDSSIEDTTTSVDHDALGDADEDTARTEDVSDASSPTDADAADSTAPDTRSSPDTAFPPFDSGVDFAFLDSFRGG
jgi:hypothetical protein